MGFEEPTPVQARAIPILQQSRDLVAQALTGTGKTAAYGIPMVERLDINRRAVQAVVLAPTRELTVQIAEHLAELGRFHRAQFLPIYGGQPIERQFRALSRGVHGVVATPGRFMDHMRRGTLDLSTVNFLVLDEADQMLQMGFQEDVEYITAHLPRERLSALFSATMPRPIMNIVEKYMRQPEVVQLSRERELTVPSVEQVYYVVPFPRKFDALCRILDARSADRCIVFCATKRMVDEVAERLPSHGYAAEALHGDVSQAQRERVLQAFRNGRFEVLVATDVAARGLDVTDLSLVVNFDIPPDAEYYVHRIGRTARSGRGGEAITFVNPREIRELQLIERATGARIHRGELPTIAESAEGQLNLLQERLAEALDRGDWQQFLPLVRNLESDHDAVEIAAAALALANSGRRPAKRRATEEPPPSRPSFHSEERSPAQRPEYRPSRRPSKKPAPFVRGGKKPVAQRKRTRRE